MTAGIRESIALAKQLLQSTAECYSPPSPEEVRTLLTNGNSCSSGVWSNIRFLLPAEQGTGKSSDRSSSISMVRNCTFLTRDGSDDLILIAGFDPFDCVELPNTSNSKDKLLLPTGLYNSTFSGTCVLQRNCRVSGTSLLKNVFVGEAASICDCGTVTCFNQAERASEEWEKENFGDECTYGSGTTVSVGVESGGRDGSFFATDTFPSLCKRLLGAGSSSSSRAEFSFFLTMVCSRSHVLRCDSIYNTYVHSGCFIRGSVLSDCSLLADGCSVTDGCCVSHSLLLGAVALSKHVHVSRSFISDCVSVSDSMLVSESVVGPDNSMSRGECHHCLLGPFVGFHHTSLLISCLWPLGRGNLGYGAMVGANHTGKAADQECVAGEGVFFGLGSKVKFPFNCAAAPYSVVAAGTVCQPQRITFPFSLILADESSNVLNVIKPAWVLAHNRYGPARAAEKFIARRESEAHITDYPVVRPTIVEHCRRARDVLISARERSGASLYTDRDIAGLGKNTLSRPDLEEAISAYTSFIRSYAMHGFLPVLTALLSKKMACQLGPVDVSVLSVEVSAGGVLAASTDFDFILLDLPLMSDPCSCNASIWAYQKHLIRSEYPGGCIESVAMYCTADGAAAAPAGLLGLLEILEDFVGIESASAAAVAQSKGKDAIRGRTIFDDYDSSHGGSDGVVARSAAHASRTVGAARLLQELVQRLQVSA